MKKYILKLVCIGVVVCAAGAAIALTIMSSRLETPESPDSVPETLVDHYDEDAESEIMGPFPAVPLPMPVRIRPSTTMVYEYIFTSDGRIETIEAEPPYFLVDLAQERIAAYYSEWEIVEFNEERVTLQRTVDDLVEEHYVLGVKDDYLAIFHRSTSGSITLKEVTATSINGLSLDERNRLMVGITVENEEQLSQMLEDYGS